MCAVMLLSTCRLKKSSSTRNNNNIMESATKKIMTTFQSKPKTGNGDGRDFESIEMDSLESYGASSSKCSTVISTSHSDNSLQPLCDNTKVTNTNQQLKRLNLNGICKNNRPEQSDDENNAIALCYVEDIILPEHSIRSLYDLQVLSLRSNDIQSFPMSVLKLASLLSLDLSDNNLSALPPEINQLANLQELVLDQNVLSVLPCALWDIVRLQVLQLAQNRLSLPPDKFADMRATILVDSEIQPESETKSVNLTNLNLRGNHLKGNIILGNYSNLTELDVSDNKIDSLDLKSVEQLEVLQCSRNNLTQLVVYGKYLTSLIAGNNRMSHLAVSVPPISLKHLDVSFNQLESLPEWLCGCQELRSVFASNNNLKYLPDHLFCNDMPYLHTLQLAYNQLHQLPSIQRRLPIQECFLQNNSLSLLPENFFRSVYNVKVLNISNNRLCDLPECDADLYLEKLLITANCLSDKALVKLSQYLKNLRIIHAAYNNFTAIPESSAVCWTEIEEIVFSGNKLLRLPSNIARLKHLTVLRVHSNLLQSIPKLSSLLALRVLDLAHNQLDRIDLTDLIPPNLKFLDLSCNTKLHVDSQQFNTYRTQRPMSLVDVSGKNRTSLPLTPSPYCENDLTESSWSVGFSETSGSKQRLYISQIRLPAFCNTEALFGMFDGENNSDMPAAVDKVVPRILLEERTCKETAQDYMKYTMLSSHRELKDKGQKHGMNAIIVHILKSKISADYSFGGGVKKYIMKIASVGDSRVVLGKANGPIRLLPMKQKRQMKTNPQIHLMVPDPDLVDIYLDEQDDYMIIANKNLWDVMTPNNAIKEVSLQRNVILAAKRLQDLAQSYGAEENLSIIVVKFNLIGTDVDQLMRELRQTIRKNNYQCESGLSNSSTCQPGCCCEALNNECITCIGKIVPHPLMLNPHDDRSSASGQSEHGCGELCHATPAKIFLNQLNKQNDTTRLTQNITPTHFESVEVKASPERRSYRGVAKALRAKREEDAKSNREETDSALSEEQFKCWEYMLEQNTQLLFDKELNTLNRAGGRKALPQFATVKNLPISRSSPHLNEATNPAILTRQFGSARSFNPMVNHPVSRLSLDKKLIGGPHAAYFGSLQRLMPYNLEYDFAVMQERGLCDSLDLDRMQQYWGVTTTEL